MKNDEIRTWGHRSLLALSFLASSASRSFFVSIGASTSPSRFLTCPANAACNSDAVGAK